MVIVVLLLLFIPVGVQFTYDADMKFFVKILFFKFRMRKKRKKSAEPNEENTDVNKKIKKILSLKKEIFELIRFSAEKCVVIKELDFKLDFGCGDAAVTGISTGVINAFVYGLLSVIHHEALVKKWNLEINPDFEKSCFDVKFNCICTTRPVHIIRIMKKGFSVLKRGKEDNNEQ